MLPLLSSQSDAWVHGLLHFPDVAQDLVMPKLLPASAESRQLSFVAVCGHSIGCFSSSDGRHYRIKTLATLS